MSTCNAAQANDSSPATRPLRWWEIVDARADGQLPFKDYFEEYFIELVGFVEELDLSSVEELDVSELEELDVSDLEGGEDEMILNGGEGRVVEPVQGWDAYAQRVWGENAHLIEEWFDAGEALAQSDVEVHIEEPDPWERALQWMRSLVVATRPRPMVGSNLAARPPGGVNPLGPA